VPFLAAVPLPGAKKTPKSGPPPKAVAVQTREEIAQWQIQMERLHFACGTIDGVMGSRNGRALKLFQQAYGLPVTGLFDEPTVQLLSPVQAPYIWAVVTSEDLRQIDPTPALWREKAAKTRLGYNNAWEMMAEKYHTTPSYLQELNPLVADLPAGTALLVPNPEPALPLPKAGRVEVVLSDFMIRVYDTGGKLVACFPCSIAADKAKRPPAGELKVAVMAPNPNYTFNPEVLKQVAEREGITRKMILPPGPNNPVGVAWMGLSLPGYGMHGTPEPEDISRTGSSGCFRLANWNAAKLFKMVRIGTPVQVLE
jgi:lipoprotein-anchoring transpeptidase ErfK/SrfK